MEMKKDSLRARKWRDANPEAYREQVIQEAAKLRQRRQYDNEYRLAANAKTRETYHKVKHAKREIYMVQSARRRAKEMGLDFNLTPEDIVIPKYCPVLKVELILNEGKPHANSASLDRKDSSKGYVKGNVWVISRKANTMKNNANINELRLFAEYVNRLGDDYELKGHTYGNEELIG